VFALVSTILKMPANEATCEFDAKYDTTLLSKESITQPFKDMLVILVCCDIVRTNEEVKKNQMDKVFIDWECSGERGNKGQFGQGLTLARLAIRCQTNNPKSSGGFLCICSIDHSLYQQCMITGSLIFAASGDKDWACAIKSC